MQGILVRGLFLVGATWDSARNLLAEAPRDEIYCAMPVLRLVPVVEDEMEGLETYECPVFQNTERSGDDNYLEINLELPTEDPPEKWVLRGVALLNQPPKDLF